MTYTVSSGTLNPTQLNSFSTSASVSSDSIGAIEMLYYYYSVLFVMQCCCMKTKREFCK